MKTEKAAPTSRELLGWIIEVLRVKHGRDILAFDVRGISGIADYYLLVSALSTPHIKALQNAVRIAMKAQGITCRRKSGAPDSGWIIADYPDVMLHIFLQETREYYNLEELWATIPQVEV
ncbi:MAG: ribosome silencing factor [Kiritimatiellia bacterium]|jgi:ribosome-associated protein